MGTTLSALTSSTAPGGRWVFVAAIEGYGYLLTNHGTPSDVVTAWAGTDWTAALSGLRVQWNMSQKLDPWRPFQSSTSSVTLYVMDASGANTDQVGVDVFNRENMTTSTLTDHDVLPGTTTVAVREIGSFPAAPSTIYIGCEAIGYDTINAGGDQFEDLSRGKWSPFLMEGGNGYARTHRMAESIEGFDGDASTSTTVASAPIDWRGKWVGVWIHRLDGSTLDTKAQAHLAFAGKIASIRDSDTGETVFQCMEVRDAIKETVILRDQWRARLRDGKYLDAGTHFSAQDHRIYESGGVTHNDTKEANDLVVVPAGAVAPNQINEGQYTGDQLATAINDWLAGERSAARLLFQQVFTYQDQDPSDATRSSLRFTDPSVSTTGARGWGITCDRESVRTFFGWGSDGLVGVSTSIGEQGIVYSANEPQRIAAVDSGFLKLEAAQGTFVDQSAFMRPRFLNVFTDGATGFVRIGDAIIPCRTPTGTGDAIELEVNNPINDLVKAGPTDWPALSVDDEGYVIVEQVLILEAGFKTLFLAMLASTGGGSNWADYDLLPEQCSAAVPYDLMTTALENELAMAPVAQRPMTIIVEKPKLLSDLLNIDCVLRGGLQLMWRQGRLALKAFATPTSAATLTIGTDDRATPIDTEDSMRAVTDEDDSSLVNVVTIKHNGNPFTGEYRDTVRLVDPGSASSYGARPATLTARNASSGAEIAGEPVLSLLPSLAAMLTFLSRPQMLVRVPIPFYLFETATAGEVCLFSDLFARDPATGRRGITSRPALVVANRYHGWGGDSDAVGEADVMLFPRLSLAPYCPCATVDDTAAGGGYDAGTKTLTVYAHDMSEAGDAVDASYFNPGSNPGSVKVRVMQIDPPTAAAPRTWDDTVAAQSGNTITLTTGLGGFVSTERYRIYADDYPDASTDQRTKCFQAHDGNGLVANLRQPYALGSFGTGQVASFTESVATELPERPPDGAAGDGVALDTGHARAAARNLNNGISYKFAPQVPEVTESMTYGGTGTWTLVQVEPVFVGVGTTEAEWTHKLYVGPTVSKSGAPSADIRVTLARRMPRSSDPNVFSRDDVVRVPPYSESTFTTSSVARTTMAAVALDIDHLNLSEGPLGGWGYLYVEVANHATFYGFGTQYVGPMEAS